MMQFSDNGLNIYLKRVLFQAYDVLLVTTPLVFGLHIFLNALYILSEFIFSLL